MKAIVPPETPGTTSAAPIAIPFNERSANFSGDLFAIVSMLLIDYQLVLSKQEFHPQR